jgi:hypothetical protein
VRRYAGYRLFLNAAIAGVVLFGLAFMATRLLMLIFSLCDWLVPVVWWKSMFPSKFSGTTLGAFLLGWGLGAFLNRLTDFVRDSNGKFACALQSVAHWIERMSGAPDRSFQDTKYESLDDAQKKAQEAVQKDVKRVIRSDRKAFETLLLYAIEEWEPVIVTLESGKAYVGSVTANFNPAFEREHVRILTIAQGYQNSETKEFSPNESYQDYIKAVEKNDDEILNALQLVLPVDAITEISPFDKEIYFTPDNQNGTEQ